MLPTDPNDNADELPDWLADADSPSNFDLSGLLASGVPAAPEPEPDPEPVSAPAPTPEPVAAPVIAAESPHTPAPKPASKPAISGEPFLYGAVIALGAKAAAGAVQIEHDVPPGLKILGTSPPISGTRGRTLIWRYEPGAIPAKLPIRLKAVTLASAPRKHDNATFRVKRVTQSSLVVPLLRPSAELEFSGPSRFGIDTTTSFTLSIKNKGACSLTDVVVQLAASGVALLSEARLTFANIPTGGTATATVRVNGSSAGSGLVRAELTTQPTTQATAEIACEVTAPQLEASFVGPAKWSVNRDHTLTLAIRNTGTASARLVDVRLAIPPGWDVTNPNERYDASARLQFAHIDELAAGSAFELPLTIRPTLPGSGRFRATAEHIHGQCEHELTATAELDPAESEGILERFVKEVAFASERDVAAPALPAMGQSREHPHVIFSVADTEYAFPLHSVREIGRPPVSTPLPGSPDWLLGVANIRGDIISMVDLRAFLDEVPGPNTQERRLLVVTAPVGDLSAGLLVDRVRGIRSIPPEQVRPPAAPINARCSSYMAGVTALERRPVVVLVPDRLLLAPEFMPFGAA